MGRTTFSFRVSVQVRHCGNTIQIYEPIDITQLETLASCHELLPLCPSMYSYGPTGVDVGHDDLAMKSFLFSQIWGSSLSKQTAFSIPYFDAHDQLDRAVRSSQINTDFDHCLSVAKMHHFVSVKVGCPGLLQIWKLLCLPRLHYFSTQHHYVRYASDSHKGSASMSWGVAVCDTSCSGPSRLNLYSVHVMMRAAVKLPHQVQLPRNIKKSCCSDSVCDTEWPQICVQEVYIICSAGSLQRQGWRLEMTRNDTKRWVGPLPAPRATERSGWLSSQWHSASWHPARATSHAKAMQRKSKKCVWMNHYKKFGGCWWVPYTVLVFGLFLLLLVLLTALLPGILLC